MNILLVGANSKGDMIRYERISIYVTDGGFSMESLPPSVMQASEFSSGKTVSEDSGFDLR